MEVFPFLVCEGGWTTDTESLARELVARQPSLYGVVQLRFATPLFNEPDLPRPDYGVILEARFPDGSSVRQGIMLMMQNGVVVMADYLCLGEPEQFLRPDPQRQNFADNSILILKGPAYRDP